MIFFLRQIPHLVYTFVYNHGLCVRGVVPRFFISTGCIPFGYVLTILAKLEKLSEYILRISMPNFNLLRFSLSPPKTGPLLKDIADDEEIEYIGGAKKKNYEREGKQGVDKIINCIISAYIYIYIKFGD